MHKEIQLTTFLSLQLMVLFLRLIDDFLPEKIMPYEHTKFIVSIFAKIREVVPMAVKHQLNDQLAQNMTVVNLNGRKFNKS